MKKIISILLIGFSLTSQAQKIKGSDTVLPIAQQQAEEYIKTRPNANTMVTGGGSGVGLAAIFNGSTDIAMTSRKVKFEERMRIKKLGETLVEKIVGYDALAVIVNPNNKVSKLTREQLELIFTGKITNWQDVGGSDLGIVVYSRETSSGTYEFFKANVLKHKNYMSKILSMPATGAIVQSVSQTPGAIGYIGIAYLNNNVKAIQISYDNVTFVEPNYVNSKSGLYPIVRPLYFYYLKKDEPKVKDFIDFSLSLEGQLITKRVGYVEVSAKK